MAARSGRQEKPVFNPDPHWRKARCSVNNGACVEVAPFEGMVAMRDSKDPEGPVLIYTPDEWHAFLHGAKAGEFDDLCSSGG
jgi:uncharacterized protein DUF397